MNEISKKVRVRRVNLERISADKNDVSINGSLLINVQIEPETKDENEEYIVVLCNIKVGGSDQPFSIEAAFTGVFTKIQPITGDELIQNFDGVSYPLLSEASLLIAQVVSAMQYPPLILSPQEMVSKKE